MWARYEGWRLERLFYDIHTKNETRVAFVDTLRNSLRGAGRQWTQELQKVGSWGRVMVRRRETKQTLKLITLLYASLHIAPDVKKL